VSEKVRKWEGETSREEMTLTRGYLNGVAVAAMEVRSILCFFSTYFCLYCASLQLINNF
jgi:hypothetical protein